MIHSRDFPYSLRIDLCKFVKLTKSKNIFFNKESILNFTELLAVYRMNSTIYYTVTSGRPGIQKFRFHQTKQHRESLSIQRVYL